MNVMYKYTFCEIFKVPRQVEGKIFCSFKHLMGFKHLNKHSNEITIQILTESKSANEESSYATGPNIRYVLKVRNEVVRGTLYRGGTM